MEETVYVFEEIRTLLFYKRNFKGKIKIRSCTVLVKVQWSIFCFYSGFFCWFFFFNLHSVFPFFVPQKKTNKAWSNDSQALGSQCMNTAIQFHYKIKTNQLGNIIVATKVLLTFRFLCQAIFNVMALHEYFVSFLYRALSAVRLMGKGCVPWPLEAAWERSSVRALPSVGGWAWETAGLAQHFQNLSLTYAKSCYFPRSQDICNCWLT